MDLLPCPFCGGKADGTVIEGSTFRWRVIIGCCVQGPEVRHNTLSDDQAAAELESHAGAIEAWNTRAQPVDAWRPIETAPKTGEPIIFGYIGSHSAEGSWVKNPARNHWNEGGWFESDADILCDHPCKPDAWMPLPNPPGDKLSRAIGDDR